MFLQQAIDARPRRPLAFLPTPLHALPRLSERLDVEIWIKRDDQTGLALGGNKARKLEFLIADALAQGADSVITTGGSQSNHARMTAAACRQSGLSCYLVLDRGVHPQPQGNLLLDELFDARPVMLEDSNPAAAIEAMDVLAAKLRAQGHTPYIIPRGGSVPTGATGYAAMMPELVDQSGDRSLKPTKLYLGTGSGGTHSGIMAGLAAMELPWQVQGISVSADRQTQEAKVLDLSNRTLDHLGLDARVKPNQVQVDDDYAGPGYGIPTPECMEAIELLALDEGIVLDPVYTGKAAAGLIGHARAGRFRPDDVVVFLHTGGAPALFAYNREVVDAVSAQKA
ncbi:MAG: D-cysteine desulfhydrase family protein [Chloroflexota bacterium]